MSTVVSYDGIRLLTNVHLIPHVQIRVPVKETIMTGKTIYLKAPILLEDATHHYQRIVVPDAEYWTYPSRKIGFTSPGVPPGFHIGATITGADSGATGYIYSWDGSAIGTITYIPTGGEFVDGERIIDNAPTPGAAWASGTPSDPDHYWIVDALLSKYGLKRTLILNGTTYEKCVITTFRLRKNRAGGHIMTLGFKQGYRA